MGSRPRQRAAAASRLDCVRHWHPLRGANGIPHDGIVSWFHGLTPTATCCRRFAAGMRSACRPNRHRERRGVRRRLMSALCLVGVSNHAGRFHGLTPTATYCRRFAAGLRSACRPRRQCGRRGVSRRLMSALCLVGVSNHAGRFHGLTPTATCCRRFAAGLRWACRPSRHRDAGSMGSRPRLRAAAASRLECVRHVAQAGTVTLVPWAHAHGYVLSPLRGWNAFCISPKPAL